MLREPIAKSASLGNTSDLTLLAPLRPGFVESLEAVTYKTRTKRVLAALHGGRQAAHEHAYARLLSDAVERVGVIQSVRVAVLEPEDKVLLAVSFDGPWEAYIRVLWEKVGELLDLVFCGTCDYVTAQGHRFDEWLAWARRVQVETGFFYGPPDFTAHDMLVHARTQRMRLRTTGADPQAERLDELRTVMPGAEDAVARVIRPPKSIEVGNDEPPLARPQPFEMLYERVRNGMQSLAALYRLTDLHRPGSADGDILHRAAVGLLREFLEIPRAHLELVLGDDVERFHRQLAWLFPPEGLPSPRPPRELPAAASTPDPIRADVQGGILRPFVNVSHGAVVLLSFDSAAGASAWLARMATEVTRDADDTDGADGRVFVTAAMTAQGLHAAGLDADELDTFPDEFRQGMAARCSVLGDVRQNHPRRWRLPQRFAGMDVPPAVDQIDMQSVHAVVVLRTLAQDAAQDEALNYWEQHHPLRRALAALTDLAPAGARVLAIQTLRRRFREVAGQREVAEHFGYLDGRAQPEVEWAAGAPERDHVPLGELLLGHANMADDEPTSGHAAHWRNGSFLVLRKYRQFVGRLHEAVTEAAASLGGDAQQAAETVYAKLMGRDRDGRVLAEPLAGSGNNFDYQDDTQGRRCPLHAHIRRANPRPPQQAQARFPRLMRRGMSYGPAVTDAAAADVDAVDRGLVFMAYNASLGEQFEVVQRWLVGGNSTGAASQIACPIVGVPLAGQPRRFRFEHEEAAHDVVLDAPAALFDDPTAPTRLEWGLYLFVPSVAGLQRLQAQAALVATTRHAPVPWELAHGRALLRRLLALEASGDATAARDAWKAAIEDAQAIDRLDAAALWAALRRDHGGLLRTSYGVIVADRDLVARVYQDVDECYSVSGQLERMRHSFGEIALGMDDGPTYRRQAQQINAAIGALTQDVVSDLAREAANRAIDRFVARAQEQALKAGKRRYEQAFEAREVTDEVLATLSEAWFGLDLHTGHFQRGGQDLQWDESRPPLYPGHFTALSRYMFQPHPGAMPTELGQRYGRALREAMLAFVRDRRDALLADPRPLPLVRSLLNDPDLGNDDGFVARTMVGVLMGFNPTIAGAVLNVLAEWRRNGVFSALRATYKQAGNEAIGRAQVEQAMARAAQMRPMPQIGWRTVRKAHRLGPAGAGGLDLALGERVVLAMVSGTQQSLEDGRDDGRLMFGGKREVAPSPTHACPGYLAGVGAMLGTLLALLSRDEALREGPSAGTFVVEGDVVPPTPVAAIADAQAAAAVGLGAGPQAMPALRAPAAAAAAAAPLSPLAARWATARQASTGGRMLVWGDSWVDYEASALGIVLRDFLDLREALEELRYEFVAPEFADFQRWGTIASMATDSSHGFRARLKTALTSVRPPRAVLLSGGGNDSTGPALMRLLKAAGSGAVFDEAQRRKHVRGLLNHYRTVLGDLRDKAFAGIAQPPLVLVHGYDHPIPAGQSQTMIVPAGIVREWLYNPFVNRGYRRADGDIDLAVATPAMRALIDDLNDGFDDGGTRVPGLSGLRQDFPWVRYVDLRGTVQDLFTQRPLDGWHNDLHVIPDVFRAMALRLHAAIQAG